MPIFSIYDYYLDDSIVSLSKIPLENQLKECIGLKVGVFDMCGTLGKYIHKFVDCDLYAVLDTIEDVSEIVCKYDIVYVAARELQYICVPRPYMKIVCQRDSIQSVVPCVGHSPVITPVTETYSTMDIPWQ